MLPSQTVLPAAWRSNTLWDSTYLLNFSNGVKISKLVNWSILYKGFITIQWHVFRNHEWPTTLFYSTQLSNGMRFGLIQKWLWRKICTIISHKGFTNDTMTLVISYITKCKFFQSLYFTKNELNELFDDISTVYSYKISR